MVNRADRIPQMLLVGLGNFGREHLLTWRKLEQQGAVRLLGISVRSGQHQRELTSQMDYPVFNDVPPEVLDQLDAVDIVTPSDTHAELVGHYLPHVHVLVEKPVACTIPEALAVKQLADRSPHALMVNHVYRQHACVIGLKRFIAGQPVPPRLIEIVFTNPAELGVERHSAQLELLHPFDILDYLLGPDGKVAFSRRHGLAYAVSLIYPNGSKANIRFGWEGTQRLRTVDLEFDGTRASANLQDSAMSVRTRESFERIVLESNAGPLENSLRLFLNVVHGSTEEFPGAATALRVLKLALSSSLPAKPIAAPRRRSVAVIGGGIFGTSCALELAKHSDVTLFERRDSLLSEATFHNQWRHHSGFHYPRSLETVNEIQATREDFEAAYGQEVIQNIPSYYCTSAVAREITRDRYIEACRAGGLEFEIADPPAGVLDLSMVDLCLRTDEGVFDYYQLRRVIEQRLAGFRKLEIRLGTEVSGVELGSQGMKTVRSQTGTGERSERFDFVVSATYANVNLLATWLGLPLQRMRFDLCEMLVLDLPLPPVSVTILDGPFTSLVATGEPNRFILSHIHESVLRSEVTGNGLPPRWGPWTSNRDNLLTHCTRYLPILKEARILESRYATRTVQAFGEDYDGRPTVLTHHGFGCWSVLGGKIVTSASCAKGLGELLSPQVLGP